VIPYVDQSGETCYCRVAARAASTVVPAACPHSCLAAISPGPCAWPVPVKLIVSSTRPAPQGETKAPTISGNPAAYVISPMVICGSKRRSLESPLSRTRSPRRSREPRKATRHC
jgi:hypothetical protein